MTVRLVHREIEVPIIDDVKTADPTSIESAHFMHSHTFEKIIQQKAKDMLALKRYQGRV